MFFEVQLMGRRERERERQREEQGDHRVRSRSDGLRIVSTVRLLRYNIGKRKKPVPPMGPWELDFAHLRYAHVIHLMTFRFLEINVFPANANGGMNLGQ